MYQYGADGIVAREDYENLVTLYLKNIHGDVVGLTLEDGSIDSRYIYDAFGNQLDNSADINPFRYCGEYYDAETGLIYLRNRYYDSTNGRFINEDPIKDGLNWYVYCGNNPVAFVDPSGLILKLEGTEEEKAAMMESLKILTCDRVAIDDDGIIRMIDNPDAEYEFSVGVSLVSSLVDNKNTIMMSFGDRNDTNEQGGIITVSLSKNLEECLAWSYESNSIERMTTPAFMSVGHELIHAYHYATGSVISNDNSKGTYYYYDENGNKQWNVDARQEELNTVGIDYAVGKGVTQENFQGRIQYKASGYQFTENALRREHFMGDRVF